jgi:chromosome segregation ATPase
VTLRSFASAVLLAAALACGNPRADSLRAEIEQARKERVDAKAVEKAKRETTDADAALSASRSELEQARQDFSKLESDRQRAREELAAAGSRNGSLRALIDEVGRRAQERSAKGQDLDAQIAAAKARAGWVRDQAAVLAREIRPEDPAWATTRRLDSLADFVTRVAGEYPDDAVAADLARAPIRSAEPSTQQARAASEQAARLRDHFASVYELATPAVAAGPPAGDAKP